MCCFCRSILCDAEALRGCGKTVVLILIELLVPEGNRTDNVSAAAIYHQLERRPRTVLLVDEADGLNLFRNNPLRSVFNSGRRRGGAVTRFFGGWSRRYPTFAPLAIAAIGMLPLPLLHRSVVVNMQRSSAQLRRLDEADPAFRWARQAIRDWASNVQLAPDPDMPSALRNRTADNWRPLLSIAGAFGRGEEARAAAVAPKITVDFNGGNQSSNAGLLLLREAERKRGVCQRLAAAIPDHRDPDRGRDHRPPDLVRPGLGLAQTVCRIAIVTVRYRCYSPVW